MDSIRINDCLIRMQEKKGEQKNMRYRKSLAVLCVAALIFSGCSNAAEESNAATSGDSGAAVEETVGEAGEETKSAADTAVTTALPLFDNTAWQYQEEDGVYWQVGISYCENPAAPEYETLGIFVPEAYLSASDNGDGTYTCQINEEGTAAGYTARTAPIVIPVNTPGYMAMEAPSGYESSAADYTAAGFVYVKAGCRGRNDGAPSGVTDLKAAVRYLRYQDEELPGSTERIFTFGMSGGGAQSALMGATGDSELYTPYLEAIGAVMGVSDAVAGSMCWCPITNLDYADEAYEWNLGVSRTELSEEMKELSDRMAEKFAEYINALELTDSEGNVLYLTQSETGIYQAGSYYDAMKQVIETSLNHFLEDTQFPYTASSGGMRGGMEGGMRGEREGGMQGRMENGMHGDGMADGQPGAPEGKIGRDGSEPDGQAENGAAAGGFVDENGQLQNDGINRGAAKTEKTEPVTYETAQDYIDSLNGDDPWIQYDSASNTATISSVEAFVIHCKNASKEIGAFDALDRSQGENILFGYGDGEGAHFDAVMAELLKEDETYGPEYAKDMERTDEVGNMVRTRVDMYNPLYYLCAYYEGYQTSQVASFWRIRTGISQGDTALATEMNLALALEQEGKQVDFETVWGQEHTMAERTGNSTENFIQWVNDCLGARFVLVQFACPW